MRADGAVVCVDTNADPLQARDHETAALEPAANERDRNLLMHIACIERPPAPCC